MSMMHIRRMPVYVFHSLMSMNMTVFTFNFIIMYVGMVIIAVVVPVFVGGFLVYVHVFVVLGSCEICTCYHHYQCNDKRCGNLLAKDYNR